MAVLLCGAASVAFADTAGIRFQVDNPTFSDDIFVASGGLSVSNASLDILKTNTSTMEDVSSDGKVSALAGSSYFLPNLRLDYADAPTQYWQLTFSVTNNTGSDISITDLTLNGLKAFNVSGEVQGGVRTCDVELGIDSVVLKKEGVDVEAKGTTGDLPLVETFTLGEPINLAVSESTTVSFKVDNIAGGNGFIGITGIDIKYTPAASPSVPEPATATLGLLALAGLAGRRRRK